MYTLKCVSERVAVREETRSTVVSGFDRLLCSTMSELTGVLLMYQWMVGAGKEPASEQFSWILSPGRAAAGAPEIRGPVGMAATVRTTLSNQGSNHYLPTTRSSWALPTVSKSGNSLLTSHL